MKKRPYFDLVTRAVTKKQMIVACGQDALALNEIQLSGKKRMSVQAFLAGSRVDTGTVLGE